jgi:hypothetical protein
MTRGSSRTFLNLAGGLTRRTTSKLCFRVILISSSLIATGAVGQSADDIARRAERLAELHRYYEIERRAAAVRPFRRELPLRPENIDDEEVREIQSVAAVIVPGAIVNIGAVVTGCPCEDGSDCSDQVWIVGYLPPKTTGVLLSKISNHWVLGPVQRWWREYERLDEHYRPRGGFRFSKEENALQDRFPVCPGKEMPPAGPPSFRVKP